MPAKFLLFGGGDWGEWSDELFRHLAADGGHAAVLACGQTYDGPDAVRWYREGAEDRLARVGISAFHVPLLRRQDADEPAAVDAFNGAAFLYVLGGGPERSVRALRGSAFWAEVGRRELTFIGSSGGAMMLGARYPASLEIWRSQPWRPGLAVFPAAVVAAHWNELDRIQPGLLRAFFDNRRGEEALVGIDLDTALVGDGNVWEVIGGNGIHIVSAGQDQLDHWPGARFTLPLI